jgi:outer membrane receptor for ferrienterochelin and colicins
MRAKFKQTLLALALLLVICRQADPAWATVDTPSPPDTALAPPDEDDEEAVVVTATRTHALMKDEPIHVEAVPTEEIEENLTESPGNISTIFLELPGVHAESVAPGLGGVEVQLRGMPSRDTLVLMDGLPLLGAESDGFGILQTPPLDLERAEVIKGAASALYGASALGGVLNLVSRMPDSQSGLLVSADSRGGQQVAGFATFPGTAWSATLTGALDNQSREDIDGDGWTDLAYHQRYTIRPRLWWQVGQDQSLFLTAGFMDEDRRGGTMPGADLPDGQPFTESLRTRRFDIGAVSHWNLDSGSLDGHLSFTSTHLDTTFGTLYVTPTMTTVSGEEAWSSQISQHHWVLGVAFEHDSLSAATVPGVGYSYNVPAVFAQDEFVARD